jgi:hypothetical protein
MDPVIPIVSIATRLNHCLIKDHTSLEKEQSLQRWVVVSGSRPQSLHIGSWGQFCLIKLLVVKIFLWSNVQAKNLHLGSAFAFEMDCSISLLNVPRNWIQYALFAEYSPSSVHRQRMLSCVLSTNWIWLTSSHRAMYSFNGIRCEIQPLSSSAFWTVRIFLLDFL